MNQVQINIRSGYDWQSPGRSNINFMTDYINNWVGAAYLNRHDQVAAMQSVISYGAFIDIGVVDGLWGPKTRDGLEQFQRKYGLFADLICGTNSWNKLGEIASTNPFPLKKYP